MAAPPVKQWGVTPPISTEPLNSSDIEMYSTLIEELKRQNSYEDPAVTDKKQETLKLIFRVTIEFIKFAGRKKQFTETMVAGFGGKIFTFGSYRLGVFGPGSDIDTLVVAPRQITREDFFAHFPTILKRMVPASEIGSITAVPDSYVPIIKMELYGIDIDLIFARIPTLNSIPLNLDLRDNRLLDGMDAPEIKSVNGTRVTDEILALVPQPKSFRTALRVVKLWAQRRAIYANILGFPGGVAWAMLVARVCQLYPTGNGPVIIRKFFHIIGTWKWPQPVLLKYSESGRERTWNPQLYPGDRRNLMPVITPAYPSMCSTYNINKSGKEILTKELKRASDIMLQIIDKKVPWSALFARHTFFTKDHRYYVSIVASSTNKDAALAWSGCVESKVRHLVMRLEDKTDIIALARPFIKGYERVHRVKTDAEAEEVKKGSSKFQIQETKTTDETNDPTRVAAAESGSVVGVAKDAKPQANGNTERDLYATTFYIGFDVTSPPPKTLDFSSPIQVFKDICSSWAGYDKDLHDLHVGVNTCFQLPDDLFDKDKGDVKPTKAKKKQPVTKKRSFESVEATVPAPQNKRQASIGTNGAPTPTPTLATKAAPNGITPSAPRPNGEAKQVVKVVASEAPALLPGLGQPAVEISETPPSKTPDFFPGLGRLDSPFSESSPEDKGSSLLNKMGNAPQMTGSPPSTKRPSPSSAEETPSKKQKVSADVDRTVTQFPEENPSHGRTLEMTPSSQRTSSPITNGSDSNKATVSPPSDASVNKTRATPPVSEVSDSKQPTSSPVSKTSDMRTQTDPPVSDDKKAVPSTPETAVSKKQPSSSASKATQTDDHFWDKQENRKAQNDCSCGCSCGKKRTASEALESPSNNKKRRRGSM